MLLKTPADYNAVIHLPSQLNMHSLQSSYLAAVAVPPMTYSIWVHTMSDVAVFLSCSSSSPTMDYSVWVHTTSDAMHTYAVT